jgi:hypothetical protein
MLNAPRDECRNQVGAEARDDGLRGCDVRARNGAERLEGILPMFNLPANDNTREDLM